MGVETKAGEQRDGISTIGEEACSGRSWCSSIHRAAFPVRCRALRGRSSPSRFCPPSASELSRSLSSRPGGGGVNDLSALRVPSFSQAGRAKGERSAAIENNSSALLVRGFLSKSILARILLVSRRSVPTSSLFRPPRLFYDLSSAQPGSHPCVGFCSMFGFWSKTLFSLRRPL